MRPFIASLLIMAALPVLAIAAVPTTISFQGLVKNPGGLTVDATQDMRFTLYDQPAGGVALWTETQTVAVEHGLFSVALGSITPFGDIWSSHNAYYVETEIMAPGGYQTLLPRTHLISTPFASEAASLHGDVETAPNKVKVEFGAGIPTTSITNVELSCDATGGGLTIQDSSKFTGAVARGIILAKPTGAVGSTFSTDKNANGHPDLKAGTVVDLERAVSSVEADTDDDGIADLGHTVVAETVAGGPGVGGGGESIESRLILTSYFQPGATPSSDSRKIDSIGGSGVHSTVQALKLNGEGSRDYLCTSDSVTDVTEVTDGSSSSSSSMRTRINELEAKLQAFGLLARSSSTTTVGDGVTITSEDSSSTTGARAKGIIVVKGATGSSQSLTFDEDGDGTPDAGAESSASQTKVVLKSFFQTGEFPTQSQFSRRLDSTGLHDSIGALNVNNEGFRDYLCAPDSVTEITQVTDGSSSSSSSMRARINELEAKLQAFGLLARTAVTTNLGDGATITMEDLSKTTGGRSKGIITVKAGSGNTGGSATFTSDSDGDGVDESEASISSEPYRTYLHLARNGSPEPKLVAQADTGGVHLTLGDVGTDGFMEMSSSTGSGPGAQPSSTLRLGRPAVNQALLTSGSSGGRVTTTSSSGSAHIQCWDGSCKIMMTDATMGSEDTSIVIDGTAKRFGIGVSEPAYPIHHSSGAHLTEAGDWTNASDIHLKENFKAVDRAELLDQIEKLSITRWNYSSQSADVTHIGPTAQEFKQVFGVGGDDKTISTIDPSGIALAAIQELTRQNRELQEQVAQLKRRLDKVEAK